MTLQLDDRQTAIWPAGEKTFQERLDLWDWFANIYGKSRSAKWIQEKNRGLKLWRNIHTSLTGSRCNAEVEEFKKGMIQSARSKFAEVTLYKAEMIVHLMWSSTAYQICRSLMRKCFRCLNRWQTFMDQRSTLTKLLITQTLSKALKI